MSSNAGSSPVLLLDPGCPFVDELEAAASGLAVTCMLLEVASAIPSIGCTPLLVIFYDLEVGEELSSRRSKSRR